MNKYTPREIYDYDPPPARSRLDNNPTLLISWWCTGLALMIILVRLGGRLSRTGKLFREDLVMGLSIVPLAIRMGLVHVILRFGTNNQVSTDLTDDDIWRRSMGSRLVLASRVFYAAFIWTAKLAVWEFLRRLTRTYWKQNYSIALRLIRVCLGLTFCAVVLSTITECRPVVDYWQVVPDPGPACRQGYGHLITMGAADILTDVLLIAFPVPIVISSTMALKRKVSLLLLFSIPIILIIITAIRIPFVIERKGSQQYRTLWASSEILAAAAISNSLVLGSFIRDRGIKKKRHRSEIFASTTTVNTHQSVGTHSCKRASVIRMKFGSDDDLIQSSGYRLDSDAELKESKMAKRFHKRNDTDTTLVEYERTVENSETKTGTSITRMQSPRNLSSTIVEKEGNNGKNECVDLVYTHNANRSHLSSLSQNSTLYDLSTDVECGGELSSSLAIPGAGTMFESDPSCQVQKSSNHRGRSISFANNEYRQKAPLSQGSSRIERPISIPGRTNRPMLRQRDSGRGFMEYDFAIVEDVEEHTVSSSHTPAADCISLSDVSPRNSVYRLSSPRNEPQMSARAKTGMQPPCPKVEHRWSDWSFRQGDNVGGGTAG